MIHKQPDDSARPVHEGEKPDTRIVRPGRVVPISPDAGGGYLRTKYIDISFDVQTAGRGITDRAYEINTHVLIGTLGKGRVKTTCPPRWP
jgi:hypothetical protein